MRVDVRIVHRGRSPNDRHPPATTLIAKRSSSTNGCTICISRSPPRRMRMSWPRTSSVVTVSRIAPSGRARTISCPRDSRAGLSGGPYCACRTLPPRSARGLNGSVPTEGTRIASMRTFSPGEIRVSLRTASNTKNVSPTAARPAIIRVAVSLPYRTALRNPEQSDFGARSAGSGRAAAGVATCYTN